MKNKYFNNSNSFLKLLAIFFIVSFNFNAFSQSLLVQKVISNMNLPKTNWYEALIVEKGVPNSNNEQIIVLPEFIDSADHYYDLKTWIIIADKTTGKIKYKTFVLQESNAVVLDRFSIDIAPYQISVDKRAFGIRTVYRGSSRANPYDYESLSLFIVDDNKLKLILNDLVMEEFTGVWDTNCAGEFTHQKKVLIITSKLTNDFYDLSIKNQITKETVFVDKTGECIGTEKTRTEKVVFKYQNGVYK